MITCSYCQSYQYSPTRMPKTDDRFCGTILKFTGRNNKSCNEIHPSTLFWCRKNGQWLDVSICLNRKRRELHSECKHCGQYSTVVDLFRLTRILNGKNNVKVEEVVSPQPILKPIVKGDK